MHGESSTDVDLNGLEAPQPITIQPRTDTAQLAAADTASEEGSDFLYVGTYVHHYMTLYMIVVVFLVILRAEKTTSCFVIEAA